MSSICQEVPMRVLELLIHGSRFFVLMYLGVLGLIKLPNRPLTKAQASLMHDVEQTQE